MNFYKLGISSDLVSALEHNNINIPTPIQELSIPPVLKGKDLIGEAQTGTGKTLAFLLPMFQNFNLQDPHVQGLIITPTRELAIQITAVAKELAETKHLSILAAYGGQDINAQLHKLKGNIQLVIGTPGRLIDHLSRGTITFSHLKVLVIDEADQMFHIGFKKEINEIMRQLPSSRQTLCYSATISHTVEIFSNRYLNNPTFVTAPKRQITLDNIKQIVVETTNRKKFEDFLKIIKQNYPTKAIIFCRSRMGTHSLYEDMVAAGFKVVELHGALSQSKREFAMNAFRNNTVKYLVATDVASRGLDVAGISHVFNYNLPDDPENYIHRIGRTGRAGHVGVAYTILTSKDDNRLQAIESFIKMKIDRISFSAPSISIDKNDSKTNVHITRRKRTVQTNSKQTNHNKKSPTKNKKSNKMK